MKAIGKYYCCRSSWHVDKLEALQRSKRQGLRKLAVNEERILISGQAVAVVKGTLLQ